MRIINGLAVLLCSIFILSSCTIYDKIFDNPVDFTPQEYGDNVRRINKIKEDLNREFKLNGKHSVVIIAETDLEKLSDADFASIMGM